MRCVGQTHPLPRVSHIAGEKPSRSPKHSIRTHLPDIKYHPVKGNGKCTKMTISSRHRVLFVVCIRCECLENYHIASSVASLTRETVQKLRFNDDVALRSYTTIRTSFTIQHGGA